MSADQTTWGSIANEDPTTDVVSMTDPHPSSHQESKSDAVLAIIGLPIVVFVILLACVMYSPVWLWSFIRTRTCRKCNIPFGRVIKKKEFNRPNIKFLLDHYDIHCICRFCGNQWMDEQIENATSSEDSQKDKLT